MDDLLIYVLRRYTGTRAGTAKNTSISIWNSYQLYCMSDNTAIGKYVSLIDLNI